MRRAAAILTTSLVLLSGCAGGETVTGDRRSVGVVSVVFSARPARVQAGQAVSLQIRLFNNAGQEREVVFPDGRLYDFWAERGSEEVWRWSDGRAFDVSSTTVTLASQDPEIFSETWTPGDAGEYRVFGSVAAEGYDRPLGGTLVVE